MIVGRDAIGTEGSARAAAVDQRPFATLSHPDGDRLHEPAAVGLAVAGVDVEVDAVQAVGAVVPMFGPATGADDRYAAMAALELVGFGPGPTRGRFLSFESLSVLVRTRADSALIGFRQGCSRLPFGQIPEVLATAMRTIAYCVAWKMNLRSSVYPFLLEAELALEIRWAPVRPRRS